MFSVGRRPKCSGSVVESYLNPKVSWTNSSPSHSISEHTSSHLPKHSVDYMDADKGGVIKFLGTPVDGYEDSGEGSSQPSPMASQQSNNSYAGEADFVVSKGTQMQVCTSDTLLSLAHTYCLSYTHNSHTTHTLSHTHSHTLSHTPHTLSPIHPFSHTNTLSFSHIYTFSFSCTHIILFHTHTHHTLSHTHIILFHTHTHTHIILFHTHIILFHTHHALSHTHHTLSHTSYSFTHTSYSFTHTSYSFTRTLYSFTHTSYSLAHTHMFNIYV